MDLVGTVEPLDYLGWPEGNFAAKGSNGVLLPRHRKGQAYSWRRSSRVASIFDSRCKFQPLRMPIGGALEHAGDAQQLLFLR